jgi:hypothetical protein
MLRHFLFQDSANRGRGKLNIFWQVAKEFFVDLQMSLEDRCSRKFKDRYLIR